MEAIKKKVLLAVDRSEHATYAYNWYVENVHEPGDYLVLVHCPEMISSATTSSLAFSPLAWQDLWNAEQELSKKLQQQYEQKMHENNIRGKWVMVQYSGGPGEAVVRLADEEKVELVVIGTRGLSTVRRTFLGSVSDYVVHHAHCPVAITRHSAA